MLLVVYRSSRTTSGGTEYCSTATGCTSTSVRSRGARCVFFYRRLFGRRAVVVAGGWWCQYHYSRAAPRPPAALGVVVPAGA